MTVNSLLIFDLILSNFSLAILPIRSKFQNVSFFPINFFSSSSNQKLRQMLFWPLKADRETEVAINRGHAPKG